MIRNKILMFFVFFFFTNHLVYGSQYYEDLVMNFFSQELNDISNGKGTYVSKKYVRSLKLEDIFPDTNKLTADQRKALVDQITMMTKARFSDEDSKTEYSVMSIFYDNSLSAKRKDFLMVSEATFNELVNSNLNIDDLSMGIFVEKNQDLLTLEKNGDITMATFLHGKLGIPHFHEFGRIEDLSSNPKVMSIFSSLGDGKIAISGSETSEGHLVELSIPEQDLNVEMLFEQNGEYIKAVKMYSGGALWNEIQYADFYVTDSGVITPQKRVARRYLLLEGEQILTFEEEYILLDQSADFNTHIEESIFSPNLPENALLVDLRSSKQPVVFRLEAPSNDVMLDAIASAEPIDDLKVVTVNNKSYENEVENKIKVDKYTSRTAEDENSSFQNKKDEKIKSSYFYWLLIAVIPLLLVWRFMKGKHKE